MLTRVQAGVPSTFTSTVLCIALLGPLLPGCNSSGQTSPGATAQTARGTDKRDAPAPSVKSNEDGTIPSGVGTEKEKPAPGKGNVQGKVLYNGKPVPGVEVKLAEKFNRFLGDPGGETFVTKTDSAGEYLIKGVTPRTYEGLLVKVFDTPYYVFATSGIIQNAKYKIEADRTYFAPDTSLFKSDLKLLGPRAGAKVGPANIEVKWAAYPDAAYYKFSIHGDSSTGAKTEYDYIDKRIDGTSYVLDKPLTPGTYSCKVVAYNDGDIKLAESSRDIKFTVK